MEVIRVLPYIQAEHRCSPATGRGHQRIVLVVRGADLQLASRMHAQPGPAAAKTGGRRLSELGIETLHVAESRIDGLRQLGGRRTTAAGRSHDLPEQAV